MFRRVLIANRGEIALRVIRTAKRLGIETVVGHSEADRGAPWLPHADHAICIGPARSEHSYLDASAILQAAEQTECQAIHPGYGFLSENPVFAARCEQQGITFVGPGADAIRRMGDKLAAKRTMAKAGIPTIPGSLAPVGDVLEALRLAAEIGYPVMLKAAAGGGGKGMRLCHAEGELRTEFAAARAEAASAFGDASLYLESYIDGGRHVEFQVLCDASGNAIHLGERECSIQRNHQKLLEEAPSPVIENGTRDEMGSKVARAVAGIGYRNAGTVEFLRSPEGRLYFMEMNTRLQVEHPVTEMITGIDLVEQQFRIAAGETLSLSQDAVRLRGHAIELRINAEDPSDGFRPDPGTITEFSEPRLRSKRARVRWESAIERGYRIPPHYDSMVGKLVVHDAGRPSAIASAKRALESLVIRGVRTTVELHRRILDDARFGTGEYDVRFLTSSGFLVSS